MQAVAVHQIHSAHDIVKMTGAAAAVVRCSKPSSSGRKTDVPTRTHSLQNSSSIRVELVKEWNSTS